MNTTWKFKEIIQFRDETAKKLGINMIEYINEDGVKRGINPFDYGSQYTDIIASQTSGNGQGIENGSLPPNAVYGFDIKLTF